MALNTGAERKTVKLDQLGLQDLLKLNGFTVVAVPSPAPKAAPASAKATVDKPATDAAKATADKPVEGEAPVEIPAPPPPPATFTLGVTDYTFNTTNAIFGRLLKTKNGHVVTQAYWLQKEAESHDEVPYYEFKG